MSGHETGWHLLALPTTIEGSPAMIGVWIACIPTVVPGVQIGLAWSRYHHEAGHNPRGGWTALVLAADLPWLLHLGLVDPPVAEPPIAHQSNSFRIIRSDTRISLVRSTSAPGP